MTAHNHRITSPESTAYNCVAWSAGDVEHWWQPLVFWPVQVSVNAFDLDTLQQAFAALDYEICPDGGLETDFEKVVLYGTALFYTHVARQLPNGKWTSKLGRAEDIEHDTPEDAVLRFMKRPIKKT